MDQNEIIVFIYLPGKATAVPAGIFYYNADQQIGNFAYGNRYKLRPDALAVDAVALPLETRSQAVSINCGLYGAFRDASPDYWGRLVIAAELQTLPEAIGELEFLTAANAARVGNLDFRNSPDDPEPGLCPPHFNLLEDIVQAARDIETGQSPARHLIQLLRQGSSVGGARPKCTVERNNALWIAKFPARNDTLNIPRIEYATMTLASKCGITIPEIAVETIGGKDIYLAKRFERSKALTGWIRRGYISSLSLMQKDENDRNNWSYLTIASLMRKFCSAEDIEQLYRRMIFNVMVRNTDDHPRNHGFLSTENGLALSPAFDIVPSVTRRGVSTEFNLAMTIGEYGRIASLENVVTMCGQFGLRPERAKEIIEELTDTMQGWKSCFSECGATQREIELVEPSILC